MKATLEFYDLGNCPHCKEPALEVFRYNLRDRVELVIECGACCMRADETHRTVSDGVKLVYKYKRRKREKRTA